MSENALIKTPMESFIAHNSRWRLAVILLSAVGFVALGMWMVGAFGEVPSSRRYSATSFIVIGWLCILFFGLCGVAIIKKFFDERPQLSIDSSGIRWAPWTDQLIPWSEIRDVTTWSYKHQDVIVLHLRNAERFPGKGLKAKVAGANRMLTGGDIAISLTGSNRSYGDAMSAIERFRQAYSRAH